jgi:uridine kinase
LVLEPLSPGGSRRCRLTSWSSYEDRPFVEEWLDVADDAVLLVDGGYLLLPLLRPLWDFVIWLDVDWETMLERASARDVAWVGSVELVRERYLTGWIPRHKWYEETHRPRELADVVVDNSDVEHPQVVSSRAPWIWGPES